jgi:hypothetical protein
MPHLFSSTGDYIAAIVVVALLVWCVVNAFKDEMVGTKCPICKNRNKRGYGHHVNNGQTRTNYRTVQRIVRGRDGQISHTYQETEPYIQTFYLRTYVCSSCGWNSEYEQWS